MGDAVLVYELVRARVLEGLDSSAQECHPDRLMRVPTVMIHVLARPLVVYGHEPPEDPVLINYDESRGSRSKTPRRRRRCLLTAMLLLRPSSSFHSIAPSGGTDMCTILGPAADKLDSCDLGDIAYHIWWMMRRLFLHQDVIHGDIHGERQARAAAFDVVVAHLRVTESSVWW